MNMSYCRFQNTAIDLADCYEHILDADLGNDENKARRKLVKVCLDIVNQLGPEPEDIASMLDDLESYDEINT